jgi:hypothetical protein
MVHHNTQDEDKQNKTQHRKLKNQQHEPHQKLRVNPPVSLDFQFVIAPSIFSNVYLLGERRYNELTCEIWDDVEKHET